MPLVTLFAGGIVFACRAEIELTTCLLLLSLVSPLILVRGCRWWAWGLLIFLAGAAIYSSRYAVLSENDLRLVFEEKPALVTLRGQLLETPSTKEFRSASNLVAYAYAQVRADEILLEKKWRPVTGVVATITRGVYGPEWFRGRRVELVGVLAPPKAADAPGLFDYRRFLYRSRIFYQLKCDSAQEGRVLSFEPMPWTERFQRWSQKQLVRGLPVEDEPVEMIKAMALGVRTSLNGEIADAFQRTGTLHIFAISGLHVTCIASCILLILRLGGLSRERAAWILIPLLWFYTLATGWQSSAVRSAFMSSFLIFGWAIRRPTTLLNSTAGAAFLILLVEPEQLFQASFQLSFSVVTALTLLLDPPSDGLVWPERIQNWILGYDPLLPPELRPVWKRRLQVPLAFVLGNLAISFASWVGSTPLTAYYFNMVTPISLVANLIAVPLSSISLAATVGSLLLPPVGPVFNYVSWATMWETITVTRWLSELPWGYFYVPKPGLWALTAYFGAVAVWSMRGRFDHPLRRWSASFAIAPPLILLCAFLPAGRSTSITLLPAAGNPIWVDLPGRQNDLLIDCSNARGAEHLIQRYLHAQGVGRLANVLVSQGTAQHLGGLPRILEQFSPRAVYAGSTPSRSRVARAVFRDLEQRPELLRQVHAGDSACGWSVLHPPAERRLARADDNSLVLLRDIAGWRILYLSSLGAKGQEALLNSASELAADILITSSETELRSDLLERIRPGMILVGASETPFARAKAKSALDRLATFGTPMLSTSGGAITLTINRSECEARTTEGKIFSLRK